MIQSSKVNAAKNECRASEKTAIEYLAPQPPLRRHWTLSSAKLSSTTTTSTYDDLRAILLACNGNFMSSHILRR